MAVWALRATVAAALLAAGVTFLAARRDDDPQLWIAVAAAAVIVGVAGLGWTAWVVRPSARRSTADAPWWKDLNEIRKQRYIDNRGLFLVHTVTPSQTAGQVADVRVFLWQHGPGPLTEGTIDSVEYVFGPRFEEPARVIGDPQYNYACEESMYGSMLCVARVHFSDGEPPLTLERYVNFEGSKDDRVSTS